MTEVKRLQPTFYRKFQENPIETCPPGGETVKAVAARIRSPLHKLVQKHEGGAIGILVPEPMASIVHFCLVGGRLGDIWKSEKDSGTFDRIEINGFQHSQSVRLELA